ncbi:glycerophosphodiester phosphodiesterase family protein [Streptomyces sp. SID13031]|uniref:glycerophosphodiester phosphodiesterase n=1 Tax=Streptomyces sp. SID13031 TaxID=2706046 RepID=UPI0013CB63FC|nr:glycerophosphodiester phosphodiesterase family protein [Streptomyces sp. SID13031]NEA36983.1 glycerophosphodiester phosphodiesterase family protein [Streptomyces sp. SID13031]
MDELLPHTPISRRTTLGLLGAAAGGSLLTGCRSSTTPGSVGLVGDYSLSDWVADRGDSYLVGHRGAGDVFPEHSMESYDAAVAWGAQAMEISVGLTADNVLVCLHDTTLDRTTNLKGSLRATTYAQVEQGWLEVPRLGPHWLQAKVKVPLFEDVLRKFGGRVVLAIEAKDERAYGPMMAMVSKYRLESAVMIKTYFKSKLIAEVKSLGLGVFAYFTTPKEMTPDAIQTVAAQLSPRTDAIVVPNSGPTGYLATPLVEAAVATGIPIWPYPLHRRSEVAHYASLGMHGAVTSNLGYLRSKTEQAITDQWASGALVPGELTRDPYDDRFALGWGRGGRIGLGAVGTQHFLTLGNLGPITSPVYSVEFQASYAVLPADPLANLTLAFGHTDDAYYEHQIGTANGYHAIMQANGALGLYAHRVGQPAGVKLAVKQSTAAFAGAWMSFRLDVTPTTLTWSRLDQPAKVTVTDKAYRGGYLHLGRASTDGSLALRGLKVTRTP